MQIIDLKIQDVKKAYKKDRVLKIKNEVFKIGLITGAYNEFILFKNGKKYPIITNWDDVCFFIKN